MSLNLHTEKTLARLPRHHGADVEPRAPDRTADENQPPVGLLPDAGGFAGVDVSSVLASLDRIRATRLVDVLRKMARPGTVTTIVVPIPRRAGHR